MLSAAPVSAAEFAAAMAPLMAGAAGPLAIAVSGGPDSSALALLTRDWARAHGVAIFALTVDHRLRPESTAEALAVGARMAALGIPHRILAWGDAIPGSAHAATRAARYDLLLTACDDAGCDRLLLGHTLDDQAETVLWRLARGSGPDGLAAMPAMRVERGIRLLRPLLGLSKARLIATCDRAGLAFVADPSNLAPRYARGRLRATRAALAQEGMTDAHLARFAARMGAMRDALDRAAHRLVEDSAQISPFGFVRMPQPALAEADPEIARRAFVRMLRAVGGAAHDAPFEAAADALARVLGGMPATLGGCAVRPGDGLVAIFRETRGPVAKRAAGLQLLWDRRFVVTLPADLPDGAMVAPWGAESAGSAPAHGVPNAAARTLPALRLGCDILYPPLAAPGRATFDWRFVGFETPAVPYGVASGASAIMYTGERVQCSARGRPETADEMKGSAP